MDTPEKLLESAKEDAKGKIKEITRQLRKAGMTRQQALTFVEESINDAVSQGTALASQNAPLNSTSSGKLRPSSESRTTSEKENSLGSARNFVRGTAWRNPDE